MSSQELLEMAESYLGETIFPTEYKEAEQYARHKLKLIIEREGDANGERRKPYYLAQLIYETVLANRFSKQTRELCRQRSELNRIMGIKKEPSPQMG